MFCKYFNEMCLFTFNTNSYSRLLEKFISNDGNDDSDLELNAKTRDI